MQATSIIGLGCAAAFTWYPLQAKAESVVGCPAHRADPRGNTATSYEEEISKSILPQAGGESTEYKESGTYGVKEGRDFQVYDHTGARVSLEVIIDSLTNVEVLFLGEYHDDPIAHALEYEIYRRAVECSGTDGKGGRGRGVSLSLEMFERDTQDVMNDYLKGRVLENDLMRDARPWPNYSDYRPMVELARSKAQHVICANAPRRYVSLAGREGRHALPPSPWLPPLPYPSPSAAYVEKTNGLMAMAASELSEMRAKRQAEEAGDGSNHGSNDGTDSKSERAGGCPYIGFNVSSKFMDAQCLWDASMAFSLARHLEAHEEGLVIHVCGKFHVEGRLGTPEHLTTYAPTRRFGVVTFLPASSPQLPSGVSLFESAPEARGVKAGDFVVLTDGNRPRSFEVQHHS